MMLMQRQLALSGSLAAQGLLGTAPRAALCLGRLLLQQRAAGSRGGRERSRGRATATRASWGLDDTTERRTVSSRGSDRFGRDRDRERRGGGPRDGPRDRPPRGGGGREAGRWGRNDRDERRGGGSGEQEPQRWGRNDRDERRGGGSGEQEPQRWGRNDRDERQGGDGRGPERWGRSNRDERQGGGGGRGQQQGQGPAVPRWAAQDDEYSWEEEEREEGEEGWGRPGQGGGGRGGGRDWGQQQQQPKAPTLRDQWVGDYLYGVSPVLTALRAGRREVHALYLQEGMQLSKRKDKAAILAVKALASELGAQVVEASKHDLNMVTDNRPHQGLVLDCSSMEFESLNSFPDPPPSGRDEGGAVPLWLCLDEVMDPQNFGAALRSAFFLGVSGVLTCHRNSAPLSAVVSKASAGAMELMAVHSVKSMPQALADARRKGWQVLGAAAEEGAVPAASFTLDRPTLLVVGNEGYGVRPVVRRLCDATLRIDGRGPGGGGLPSGLGGLVDSLNVSVATGILLHQLIHSQPGAAAEAAGAGAKGS